MPRGEVPTAKLVTRLVAVSTRETVPSYSLLTQIALFVAVIEVGPSRTSMVLVTWLVARSIRETFLDSELATHTSTPARAMPRGPEPTKSGRESAWRVWMSIWVTVPSLPLATQMVLPSTARPSGPSPTGSGRTGGPVLRIDALDGVVSAVGDPHPARSAGDRGGLNADRYALHLGVGRDVDPRHAASEVRDPHVIDGDGDRDRGYRRRSSE
jgi:hypothetical protein